MDEKRQKQREDSQRIMVNSDEELIEALKEINNTLEVKETPKTKKRKVERKIINKKGKEKENGRKRNILKAYMRVARHWIRYAGLDGKIVFEHTGKIKSCRNTTTQATR